LAVPIVGLATVVGAWTTPAEPQAPPRSALACLLAFAILGPLFLVKWVNMSLDGIWHMKPIPLPRGRLVVAAAGYHPAAAPGILAPSTNVRGSWV